MTKIRLTIDVAVDTKAHAQTLYDALKDKIAWFGQINPATDYFIAFHICQNDDPKAEPCNIYEEWRNGVVTWHEGNPVP